jgi:plasmid maintenance system antidote protein VapI
MNVLADILAVEMRAHVATARPEAGAVLTKAALNAAALLGISSAHLATVIGVSAASVSRLHSAQRSIDPTSKEGELALTFLRLYRSLGALLGNTAACRNWFHSENSHLGGVPAELVQRVEGLVHVTEYLDAMRGKV